MTIKLIAGFERWYGTVLEAKEQPPKYHKVWKAATERCLRALDKVNGRSQGVYTQLRDIRKLIEEDENL